MLVLPGGNDKPMRDIAFPVGVALCTDAKNLYKHTTSGIFLRRDCEGVRRSSAGRRQRVGKQRFMRKINHMMERQP
jgi:hypothetical protein